jgi:peptide/nickel transport system substrate-binding protein
MRHLASRARLAAAGLGLGMTLVLGACGGGGSSTATGGGTRAGAPAAQVLTVAMQYDTSTLDPAAITAVTDQQEAGNIFEGLVRYKLGTTDIEPALAEQYAVSSDGLTYTFHLRPGLQFQQGFGPVSSADVKFSLQRITDPATKSPWASLYDAVAAIDTPDAATVVIHLKHPDPSFLVTLAGISGSVVSQKAVAQYGQDFGKHPVGAGPFAFDHWTPQAETVLVANPNYWGGAPKLSKVVFKPITDAATMYAAFESGDVDLIQVTDPDKYQTYKADPADYTISEVPGLITRFMGMNTRIAPLDKPAVRQAIEYAINRQDIVQGLFKGISVPAVGALAPGVAGYTTDLPDWSYDPAKAKQLLSQAGLPDGFKTSLWTPNIDRFTKPATVIKQQLAAVGIQADIRVMDTAAFLAAIAKGQAPLFILSRGQEPQPDRLFYTWFDSKSFPPGNNWAYFSDPQVDRALDQLRSSTDPAVRAADVKAVETAVNQAAVYVFIDHEKMIFAARSYVKGFQSDPFRSLKLATVSVQK